MGKFLRVLVILLLLLSIGALWVGCLLFQKRELLKGRTQKLENYIVYLGKTIEEKPAELKEKPEYPSRDVSPLNPEILENPDRSPFWTSTGMNSS